MATKRIEKIQHKFSKNLGYRYGFTGPHASVDDVYDQNKVVNCQIDVPDICSCFEFATVGLPLRHNRLLKTTKTTKNYVLNSLHDQIASLVNILHNEMDF